MFQKISAIDATTGSTAKQIETLSSTVTQLVTEVASHKESLRVVATEIQVLQKVTKTLKEEVDECKRYIEVLSNVVPGISDNLEDAVDIAHRLAQRRKDGSHRSIIILFALRRFRDIVWQADSNSP
ncbi:hypothetical protein DPX16_21468 [Anabarilius grahami]|uniref:Uncharacterized protein n=1 Tax=Anabarilius grahami TaxID=495550 RepID=A0A3N0XUV2_ANAGA|nr:hypothetical protein DPX16_21468 [Anabarilius grahami]